MNEYNEEIVQLHIDSDWFYQIEVIADASFISPTDVILQAIKEFLKKEKQMNDIKKLREELTQERIKNAMVEIEENMRLSFHHYSVKLGIPAQDLQEAWATYSYEKKNASA